MHRRTLLSLALLLVLLAVLAWRLVGERGGAAAPGVAPPVAQDPEPSALAGVEASSSPQEPPPARSEVAAHPPVPAAPAGEPGVATCVVLGRVLDERGAPLGGARVRLQGYRGWAEGHEVARLEGALELHGFEVRTDAAGAFSIEAPVPTVDVTWLTIEPDPHHDSHQVSFGAERGADQPALGPGPRDLGTIRLATTGAIHGRVSDLDGQPLAGVEIIIGSSPRTTLGRDTETRADGTYLLAHAPVGTYGVRASAEGFLTQSRQPVTVEGARDTGPIDFALAPAPTLEGIVVDEAGRPLEGARLHGWPAISGKGAWTTSGADGRFTLHLPQDEPYSLAAELDGHHPWGDVTSRVIPPGTRGIEVVLATLERTRFLVVDAEEGRPIERFGLEILADNGSRSSQRIWTERRPPRQAVHPGGVLEATARPGIDLVLVAAEGYLLQQEDVAHAAPDVPEQTIRLRRAPLVRGRVLRDGVPVAAASVQLDAGALREVAGPGGAPLAEFEPAENTRTHGATGADGRFELAALQPGVHRLQVWPPSGAPLVLAPLALKAGKLHELGDLAVLPGGSIAGHVLLPPGVDPAGLRVGLGERGKEATTVTDPTGAFRFDELASGVHTVRLGERPRELAAGAAASVEVVPGETVELTLDARDRGMCRVRLTIELGDLDAAGCSVELRPTAEDPVGAERARRAERAELGTCDEHGRVAGAARAWGEAAVFLRLSDATTLEHPSARLDLRQGIEVDELVRFELATLRLHLPPGVALPRDGTGFLELDGGQGAPRQRVFLTFAGGALVVPVPGIEVVEGPRGAGVRLACLLPGSYELTLQLTQADAPVERTPLEGGTVRFGPDPYFRGAYPVVLVAGEELVLELE